MYRFVQPSTLLENESSFRFQPLNYFHTSRCPRQRLTPPPPPLRAIENIFTIRRISICVQPSQNRPYNPSLFLPLFTLSSSKWLKGAPKTRDLHSSRVYFFNEYSSPSLESQGDPLFPQLPSAFPRPRVEAKPLFSRVVSSFPILIRLSRDRLSKYTLVAFAGWNGMEWNRYRSRRA